MLNIVHVCGNTVCRNKFHIIQTKNRISINNGLKFKQSHLFDESNIGKHDGTYFLTVFVYIFNIFKPYGRNFVKLRAKLTPNQTYSIIR